MESELSFKIVVVGDSGVGKTCLCQRYVNNGFTGGDKPTIGVNLSYSMLKISGTMIKVELWDTAGLEKFQTIPSLFYRGSIGAIVVYDLTNRESFSHVQSWIEKYQELGGMTNIPRSILLIGNKSDVLQEREIESQEGEDLAKSMKTLNTYFFETSAKSGKNVTESFNQFIQNIYQIYIQNHKTASPEKPLDIEKKPQVETQQSTGCC
ncbi:rab11, putative [Entamoeba invadens IP1]|uniref:Rab11, putative n=1 Tax=Entamoeba invadens IP1 TaxID=370355 RepID=A0A0A1U051_ENTIV|nr:rab11, putative [Entamoeba invadens IP1]ELP87270.1 rab11, putative [Entamoeba invadens IP1]|eukprot:XP_004254041.1 rab11, putative [Entamoeba invadens IP1]